MTIPTLEFPKFNMVLPVDKIEVKYRPMVQRDEKILLIAKESNEPSDILGAIKQVVQNCLLPDDKLIPDTNNWSLIDLEWAFIQLRSTSVSNVSKVSYIDGEDQEKRDFDIDLNKIEVKLPDPGKTDYIPLNIDVDEHITIKLRYPPATLYTNKEFLTSEGEEAVAKLIAACIKAIVVDGKSTTDFTFVEAQEFTESLPIPIYQKLTAFVSDLPHLHYEIKYTNNEEHERIITLSTLNDFFTFV